MNLLGITATRAASPDGSREGFYRAKDDESHRSGISQIRTPPELRVRVVLRQKRTLGHTEVGYVGNLIMDNPYSVQVAMGK